MEKVILGTIFVIFVLATGTRFFEKYEFVGEGRPNPECQYDEEDEDSPDCICNTVFKKKYSLNWGRILIAIGVLSFEMFLFYATHYNQY